MYRHNWFLMGTVATAAWIAGPTMTAQPIALAQTSSPPGVVRERAPGVPIAPNPGTVARREGATPATRPPQSGRRDVGGIGPDSTLPMPKGVPSIMAP